MKDKFDHHTLEIVFVNLSPLIVFCADINKMAFFLFFVFVLVVNWIEYVLLESPTKHLPGKMHAPRAGSAVGYGDVDPAVLFEDPLALLEHHGGIQVSIIAAKQGVYRRLVNGYVEKVVRETQVAHVHNFILHALALLVPAPHLFDDHARDIDIPLVLIPAIVEIL